LVAAGGVAFAAPGWQRPAGLVTPDEFSKGPDVAINERGDLAIVWWQDFDSYNSSVRGIVRPAGGSFSSPRELSDPAGTFPPRPFVTTGQNDMPQVAVGPAGEAVVVWARENGIRSMTLPPGASTGPRSWAHEFGPQDQGAHRMELGMDGAGNATVFWSNDHVHYVDRPRGGSFGARHTIPNPGVGVHVLDPGFAVSAGGGAAVVWNDYEQVYAAARDAGGSFAAPQTIGLRRAGITDVAMDAKGNALAVWTESHPLDAATGVMQTSYRPAHGRFGPPQAIGTLTYGWPKVAMSRAGEAIITWGGSTHGVSNPARITAVSRSSSGAFGGFEPVARDYNGLPRLAIDSGGNAYMAWQATWGDEIVGPYAAVRPAGGSFSGQTHRLGPGVSWGPTAIAAGAPGKAVAVWPINVGGKIGLQLAEHGEARSGSPIESLRVRGTQRGHVVKGSVRIGKRRCALDVRLRRAGRTLGRSKQRGIVAGVVKFTVRLRRGARSSLRKHRSLRITVRARVSCKNAAAATATRRVKLRRF
jgi:hypothetical protein